MTRKRINMLQASCVVECKLFATTPPNKRLHALIDPGWLGSHIAKFVGLGKKKLEHLTRPHYLGLFLALQHITRRK